MAKAVGKKNQQVAEVKQREVIETVKGLTMDGVANKIANTQVEIQKTLAQLSTNLTEKLSTLQTVEEAIALQRAKLQELYQIEAQAHTADELNGQILAQREAWAKEQQQRDNKWAEEAGDRKKQWAREETEYKYALNIERQKETDTHAQKVKLEQRAHQEKLEQMEKNWKERETTLAAREKELEELKAKVAAFPEDLKKEVAREVAIATNSQKRDYETKITLLTKDAETEKKLAAQTVASAQDTIAKLNQQITDLRTTLDQAHKDVKEISGKALDSASGRHAMEAMRDFATSSKDTPTKGGK